MAIFNLAIPHILRWEGGYINHPADPGGETKYGITKKRYPDIDIKNLTKDDAKDIYLRDFWEKGKANEINNQDTATHYLDLIVNHGRYGGTRILQRALNNVGYSTTIDGLIGPNTLSMVNKAPSKKLNSEIAEVRKDFYQNLIKKKPQMKVFERGWLKRANYYKEKFGAAVGTTEALLIASIAVAGIVAMKLIKSK